MTAALDPAGPPEQLARGVWRLPLPDPYPPGATSVFLLEEGEPGPWLLDVGAEPANCQEALEVGLRTAGVPRRRVAGAILSHTHLDHAGGLFAWTPRRLVTHHEAAEEMRCRQPRSSRGPAALRRMGVPAVEVATLAPFGEPVGERPLPADRVTDELEGESGALPFLPGWRWTLAGGHAPGHLLLFQPESGILLAGDQFLDGWKTPYRIADPEVDAFGAYLRSVDAAIELAPRAIHPSHTPGIEPAVPWLRWRRRALTEQAARTAETVRGGARTAYEAVLRLYPAIRPGGLRVLLLREQLAILRHLAAEGRLERAESEGVEVFAPAA